MIIQRVKSFAEYLEHKKGMECEYKRRWELELKNQPEDKKPFLLDGISYPAGEKVKFKSDFKYSNGNQVNWREQLVCPVTGLNNRLRAAVHLADSELGLIPGESIYLTEQTTPLFRFFQKRHPKIVDSEYLESKVSQGSIDKSGIRNEDLTRLSFEDKSFDIVLSFECLEHVPNFDKAMKEMARVLKPGGKMMWSVPFRSDRETNLNRAELKPDGTIVHHEPPEYHGDPLNPEGCLCFTHFGWQMLDQVKNAGFQTVYAVFYWSDIFCYFGRGVIFVAIKSRL